MRAVLVQRIRQRDLLVTVFFAVIGAVLTHALAISATEDVRLEEISTPQATYPKGVYQKGHDGYVTVVFDVSKRGQVQNPCIVDSSYPGLFDLYALQAVRDYRYKNMTRPRELVQGVTSTVPFTLDSNPTYYVPPEYPRDALEFGYQGYVVVSFGLKRDGKVRRLETTGAVPVEIFEKAALDAARQFRFDTERFSRDETVEHKFSFSLDSKPNNLVVPEYPEAAKEQGLQGHVVVEFSINSGGSVDGAYAIYSSEKMFEQAAIDAVSQFTFDQNKPAHNVLHRVEFILNRTHRAVFKAIPKYPREAVFQRIEGEVVVNFDINENGAVDNLSVLEAEPPDIFNESALEAAAQFKYLPKYVDGKPVRVENVRNRLRFALGLQNQQQAVRQGVPRARPANQRPRTANQGRRPSTRRGQSEEQSQQPAIEDRRPESMRDIKLEPIYSLHLDEWNYPDGSVIVQFDVNQRGYVEGPKIVEMIGTSLPKEITERILDEVSFFWYAPYIENSRPVRVNGVQHKIELSFDDE